MAVSLGDRTISYESPIYFAAEIGINHNGDMANAKKLITIAKNAGCDAVKFQKRTPDIAVPEHQKNIPRETPWGVMTYLNYKKRIEFGQNEYEEIDAFCRKAGIAWFASCWDIESVDFVEQFDVPAHKVASASLANDDLVAAIAKSDRPVVLSTGMSTQEEVDKAISHFNPDRLILCHSVSSYPCPPEDLNLKVITTYREQYPNLLVGYSGHEVGLPTTYAAAALGACYIERHITLDRAMWGTDQAASVEPQGLKNLVERVRTIQRAMGDGVKRVADSEVAVRRKLRGN